MSGTHNIRIDQGATWRIRNYWREPLRDLLTDDLVLDDEGEPLPGPPLSLEGYTARMQVRKAVSDTVVMLELTTENGGILITQPTVRILDYVRVAATSNLAALSGLLTIDGVLLEDGDRVLVAGQTAAEDDGIYVAAEGAWARSADADTYQELQLGATVWVRSGAAHGDAVFRQEATLASLDDAQTWVERDDIGSFVLQATAVQTAALASSGVYDVELVSSGGDVYRVLQGKMRLSQEVTRSSA